MDRLLYTAMTGATGTLSRQAAVAHNLANVTSTGYRAEEHRLRAVEVQRQGEARVTALPTRAFVVDASTYSDFTTGPMQYTGRSQDMAVEGPGWIALAMPEGGEAYTRNGNLEVSINGVLQTRSGLPVQGEGGPITLPPDVKVTVGKDGIVSVVPESGGQNVVNVVGRIKLVNPPPAALIRGGDGLFRLGGGEVAPVDETVRLSNGYLEGSNVNPAAEMVNMISLARQFEMQMKMIQNADTNDRAASQILSSR